MGFLERESVERESEILERERDDERERELGERKCAVERERES